MVPVLVELQVMPELSVAVVVETMVVEVAQVVEVKTGIQLMVLEVVEVEREEAQLMAVMEDFMAVAEAE